VRTAETVEEAVALIEAFQGQPEQLLLSLPETLFAPMDIGGQMVTGMAAALLTDRALSRGWIPSGAEVSGSRRIWKFGTL
jgi:hypothetical protein